MEITKELLIENGFKSNHPDYVITTFTLNNKIKPEWNISISKQYMPYTNKLTWNCDCWLCNDKGVIIKRGSLSDVNNTEDFNLLIKLCNIDFKLPNIWEA